MSDSSNTTHVPNPGPGRARQSEIYRGGAIGRRPAVPTDFGELERLAERVCSPRAVSYTHLDVYKRQTSKRRACASSGGGAHASRPAWNTTFAETPRTG